MFSLIHSAPARAADCQKNVRNLKDVGQPVTPVDASSQQSATVIGHWADPLVFEIN
jgi:hypothetical protein